MKAKISEGNDKAIKSTIFMIALGIGIYFILNSKQREIDKHFGVTQGMVTNYLPSGRGGKKIEYKYFISKYYVAYAVVPSDNIFKASKIFFDKNYLIEYSTVDPSNSRIVIDGVRYKSGVD